jgi:hypothetical protein
MHVGIKMNTAIKIMAIITAINLGIYAMATIGEAKPPTNCECQELRAIRRILEQQYQVVCDERRCLPVPTPTASTGGPLE